MESSTLSEKMISEFNDIGTERHLNAKPPKEAYFYFPSQKEMVEYDPKIKEKTYRKIFENKVPYLDFENQKLNEFYENLEKNSQKLFKKSYTLPENFNKDNVLRFIQATCYDCAKALKLIHDHIEWRNSFFPINLSQNSMKILNSGFLYVHGRDHRYRPIVVMNADIYLKYKKAYTYEDWLNAVIYLMEYIVNNMLIPGQVENWVIICDFGKVSLLSPPSEFQSFMSVLQSNYRCRLYCIYLIGVGTFVRILFNMIKGFLDATTQRKIRLVKSKAFEEIFEIINPSQVEKRFGGKAENVENYYFPPVMPNNNEILRKDDRDDKSYVTEDEYFELTNSNKVTVVCPFDNLSFSLRERLIDKTNDTINVEQRNRKHSIVDDDEIL